MTEEFNLSKMLTNTASYNYGRNCFLEEDVKEFIKRLKLDIKADINIVLDEMTERRIINMINKLAGGKLI